jgi:hypothetical protein
MTLLRKWWGVVAGLALVGVANAVALGGVAWNRAGEPEATLVLTQREVTLPALQIGEDTGLALYFALGGDPWWEAGAETWLDRDKLAELGFAVDVDPTAPEAQRYYAGTLPRQVFVTLEYDGAAWAAWLARQEQEVAEGEAKVASGEMAEKRLEERRQDLARARDGHSRLFVVDAARDATALWQRHPDHSRYAVVPAVVRLHHGIQEAGEAPRLTGYVAQLLVAQIHVSLPLRPVLDAVSREMEEGGRGGERSYRPAADRPPRYQAKIAFGRRHEPWLMAVERLSAEP